MSRPPSVDKLDPGERAREPRSLGLIAYFDGWGQAGGLPPATYPRLLTTAEAEQWQQGWDEAQAAAAAWAEQQQQTIAMPGRTPAPAPPAPDGFTAAARGKKWACDACGVTGFPEGRWMEPHQREHHPCPDCGRMLTAKLDGTPRVHTRCARRPK